MKKSLYILLSGALLSAWNVPKPAKSTIEKAPDTLFRTMANNAWQVGEELEYRVHYGLVNAGYIKMSIGKDLVSIKGRNTYHITASGRSASGFDWFYKVRDQFESYIDEKAILPHQFIKSVEEGSYKDSDFAIFNYTTGKVSSARKGVHTIPPDIQDIISAVYYCRTLDISAAEAGDIFPVSVYLDGEIHALKVRYVKKEKIKTSIGEMNAIKIVPMVIADRIFKEKEGLELWVSDDENKVPLRVKAELLVGSLKVDITKANGLRHPLNKH
jgi:hypothetical protein